MCNERLDHCVMLCPFKMRKRDSHHIQFDSENPTEALAVSKAVRTPCFELLSSKLPVQSRLEPGEVAHQIG